MSKLKINILKEQIKHSEGVIKESKIQELEDELIKSGDLLEGEFVTAGVDY